jgi:hypothetical protein
METRHTSPTPLSRALETIKRLRAQLAGHANQPLAVVGVGMRFPGATRPIDNLDTYWQALAEARDLVRPMPAARKARFAAEWDALPHKGGFLDDVTGFDAAFFGISPREARAIDPQHRLLLEVTWEALENAALPPERLRATRTGLYVGITGQDYRDWQVGAPDAYWATTASPPAASPTRWVSPVPPSPSTPPARRRSSPSTSPARRCAAASATSPSRAASASCCPRARRAS